MSNNEFLSELGLTGDRLLNALSGKSDYYLTNVDNQLNRLIEKHLTIAEGIGRGATGELADKQGKSLRLLDTYLEIQKGVNKVRQQRKQQAVTP